MAIKKKKTKPRLSTKESDKIWLEQLEKLSDFLWVNLEIKITPHKKNTMCYAYENNEILLSELVLPRPRFYFLLHELGHMILFKKTWYDKKYKTWSKKYQTVTYKVKVIEEEIEAWSLGEQFARYHDYYLGDGFDVARAKALKSYIIAFATHDAFNKTSKNYRSFYEFRDAREKFVENNKKLLTLANDVLQDRKFDEQLVLQAFGETEI